MKTRITLYAGDRTELDIRFQKVIRKVKGNRSELIKRAVVEYCRIEEEQSEIEELRRRVEELERMIAGKEG
jgi:metal-responsive CopG/Arc/MetJ family transcriptional regulator